MSNIRQQLLLFERSCRFRFMQTFNCYNSVNIAARLTKVLPTHSAAHGASIRVTNIIYTLIRELRVPRDAVGPRDHVAPKINPLAPNPPSHRGFIFNAMNDMINDLIYSP